MPDDNKSSEKIKPRKLPAFQFYPGDWLKDPCLRRCSLAARGLWIDLLCLMWESQPRGVLMWTDEEIITMFGAAAADLITELLDKGVTERNKAVTKCYSSGFLVSRRMLKDEAIRAQTRARVRKSRQLRDFSNGTVTALLHGSSSSSSDLLGSNDPNKPPKALFFPPTLDTAGARAAWSAWLEHKKSKGQKYKSMKTQQTALNHLAELGTERFVKAIQHSIGNNYSGIFESRPNATRPRATNAEHAKNVVQDILRESLEREAQDDFA